MVKTHSEMLLAQGINKAVQHCNQASRDAGWWTNPDGTKVLDNPLAVSNKLLLIVTEVAEAAEGDRKDCMDTHLKLRKMLEVELADAAIRIFDLAGELGYDLGNTIIEKMQYNAHRADHKVEARGAPGGKRY
jgi:NTP pyrophosphatase (non-canonical NTP hydrolase)